MSDRAGVHHTLFTMREYILATLSPRHNDPAVVTQLRAIYSKYPRESGWTACLPANSKKMRACMDIINEHGLQPWRETWRPSRPDEFQYSIIRRYDDEDLDQCRLMQLVGARHVVYRYQGTEDKIIRLERNKKLKWLDGIAAAAFEPHYLFASDSIRKALESLDLVGIQFRPTIQIGQSTSSPNEQQLSERASKRNPWWGITSSIILPPLSSSATLIDHRTGEPFDPVTATSCTLVEGDYAFAQLRYRQADVDAVPPFDIAVTHERFGVGVDHIRLPSSRAKVVSQRFRQLCKANGIQAHFVPVQIEP